MRIKFFILTLLWQLGTFSSASGQHYPFETYTELDGLPSSAVHAVSQDNQGRMWFATRSGLVSFDGVDWEVQGAAQGLPFRIYSQMDKDDLGRIWIAMLRSPVQVAYLENDQWVLLPELELKHTGWTIKKLKVGRHPDGSILAAIVADEGFLCIWNGVVWQQIGQTSPANQIHDIIFLNDRLLIASSTGLSALDLNTWKMISNPLPKLPPGSVYTLAQCVPDTTIWLVGDQWIGLHHRGSFQLLADNLAIRLPAVQDGVTSLPDQSGGLYFGDKLRLYYFSKLDRQLEPVSKESGLINDGASCLFQDREGHIWISGLRGINKLISRRFVHFDTQEGLFRDEVSAVLVRESGEIILGHEDGLTFMSSRVSTLELGGTAKVFGRVIDLEEGNAGSFWVAADRLGLAKVEPDGTINWFREEFGLTGPVYALHRDNQDRFWVGTGSGLFRQKGNQFERVFLPELDNYEPPFIRRIVAGREGSILVVAGTGGVYRLSDDRIDQWHLDDLPNHSFYTAFEKEDGQIWAGTSHGLFSAVGNTLQMTEFPAPVINRPIYSIVERSEGEVWFGTDAGVLVWTDRELKHYTTSEGLLGNETNRDALQVDRRGRVWIGTDRGLSIYTKAYDLAPMADPIILLQGFDVNESKYLASEKITKNSPLHSLTAHYAGISFGPLRDLGVATWLENFETSWQKPGPWAQRSVRYTNLAPGKYRLHLRVENTSGYIGPEIVSNLITINRPVWARWWFFLLVGTACLLLFRIAFSFYSNKQYARRLEKEIQRQTWELKESEKSTRAESQRFLTTLNSISEGVLTLDVADRIIFSNSAAETILGWTASDLTGKMLSEINSHTENLTTSSSIQLQYKTPDGKTIWLEVTSTPIKASNGQHLGAVLVLRDNTEKRNHEDELVRGQKLESLGLLAGGIAHDFNNLLTIILGNVDLAAETDAEPMTRHKHINKARTASYRAQSLTDQLLTFARGGAPQRQLSSMIEISQQASSLAFSGTVHSCNMVMDEDLWPVSVDPGQMAQVLSNLFINACQAMINGGTVYVTGQNIHESPAEPGARRYVMIEIRDTGIGIPRENLTKIFDPYFTTKDGGSGLGLATSYSIIKRHDGHLKVESEYGHGSTFRIYLKPDSGVPIPETEEALIPIEAGQRILIMDDEMEICLITQQFLKAMGLECVITTKGEEAITAYKLAIAENRKFAAALFDLTVAGGMGGRETVEKLLKIDPSINAIVVSGYSNNAVMSKYQSHGFVASLSKPFDQKDLALLLGRVLQNKKNEE